MLRVPVQGSARRQESRVFWLGLEFGGLGPFRALGLEHRKHYQLVFESRS